METTDHDLDESLDSFPGFIVGGPPRRDETAVEIITTRPMLVLRIGERMPRHAAPGDRCTVPEWTLGSLPPDSFDRAE